MKKHLFSLILSAVFIMNITGCVPLIVGGAVGVLGGYALSRDTIQAETEKPYDELWRSVLEVSRIRGVIIRENPGSGEVELRVDSSRVWITLIRLTPTAARLRVSARKYGFPNLSLAQDIFVKIMERTE